jgi:hypothetical protein
MGTLGTTWKTCDKTYGDVIKKDISRHMGIVGDIPQLV